jgi:transposase
LPPCLIGMEACVGAHHLSRRLIVLGRDARLMPTQYVKPFLKGHKNDYRDAEAAAEAMQRPTMRFAAAKMEEQLDLQALHRVRARLVAERTATPTKSGLSCSSAALQRRKAFIVSAKLCLIFLPKPRMLCRRA